MRCSPPLSRARVGVAVAMLALPICGAPAVCQLTEASLAVAESPADKTAQRRVLEHPAEEMKGDIAMARGEYASAIDAYVSLHSRSALVWNKIGMAYHHLFALEAARKAYEQALSMNPRFAPAANNLAAIYYAQRDFKQAEHYYKKALKYTQEDAVIYCNLGTAYFAEKNYNKGKKVYRKALALDHDVFTPNKASLVETASSREQRMALNYYLAQTFAELNRQDDALLYLRKALDDGFNDRRRLTQDKEFAALRTTQKYQQLLTEENMN